MNPFSVLAHARSTPIIPIFVPEWSQTFHFRALSALEWMEACDKESAKEFPAGVVKVAATACTLDGHRIEGAELTSAMQSLANASPLGAVQRLAARVAEINGEGATAVEAREKNSPSATSSEGSSTSQQDSELPPSEHSSQE